LSFTLSVLVLRAAAPLLAAAATAGPEEEGVYRWWAAAGTVPAAFAQAIARHRQRFVRQPAAQAVKATCATVPRFAAAALRHATGAILAFAATADHANRGGRRHGGTPRHQLLGGDPDRPHPQPHADNQHCDEFLHFAPLATGNETGAGARFFHEVAAPSPVRKIGFFPAQREQKSQRGRQTPK
jgi:hypothetical protein